MTTEVREDDLMLRVAGGDSVAFAQLFDLHASKVLGSLVALLRRREVAEEVLQETFLQAWSQAERYNPARATPAGWLLMLARSRALDRLRSATARERREERTAEAPQTARFEQPVGTRQLETEERRRMVVTALGELPPDQRRCLEMAFYDGRSQSEIATRLDMPLGTVKSRVRAAMKKVGAAVRPYFDAGEPT